MSAALAILFVASPLAHASPNVPLDEPVYEALALLRAEDRLPPYFGGLAPLTEARIRELLAQAGEPTQPEPTGWWVRPLSRAALRASAFREDDRPYSTSVRPRDVVGFIGMSCEGQEGRPCGHGVGLSTELDSDAGYDDVVSASIRLRARAGTASYGTGVDLDRAYVNGALGPVALEAGRDVLVLGPSSRTQLGWGENAPPLDHVRASTSRPLAITSELRGSLVYVVGRLRDPQTYPGNLVTIARGQLDIANRVEIGMMQLLQLEGDGAPHLGPWEFLVEHFTRHDLSAGPTDSSNRRVGFDVATRIDGFHGARLYYQLVFEDWRKRFDDALRYDADHLVGMELAALHGIVIEWQKTGVRSQEHSARVTGFTNAGRVVGSPLGPDAQSVFASGRIHLPWGVVSPWAEVARLGSDTFTFIDHGPILHATDGVAEFRYRMGARLRVPLQPRLRLEAEAMAEHVEHAGFDPAARRENVGISAMIVWHP